MESNPEEQHCFDNIITIQQSFKKLCTAMVQSPKKIATQPLPSADYIIFHPCLLHS